jgi:hypothetical protein
MSAPHGMLGRFAGPDALLEAVRAARRAGFTRIDAFSPFPIEGMDEALGLHDDFVPLATLFGGIAGLAAGIGVQVWAQLSYPLDVGGRPLMAWPAFALIGFEVMVLGAVTAAILGMLARNGLPRLHHPLFDVAEFHLATDDRFFLLIEGRDRRFPEAAGFLAGLKARAIDTVPA